MVKNVINIEDTILKHGAIIKELKKMGIRGVALAQTAEEGIEEIERAIKEDRPYELLITDMSFPVDGVMQKEAGMYVISELKKRNIEIPIIVCSSVNYRVEDVAGFIKYNEKAGELDGDLWGMVRKIKR